MFQEHIGMFLYKPFIGPVTHCFVSATLCFLVSVTHWKVRVKTLIASVTRSHVSVKTTQGHVSVKTAIGPVTQSHVSD